MSDAPDTTEIDEFFKLRPPTVKKNCEVVTPGQLGQKLLLHISVDHYRPKFVPSVTRRSMADEDRQVPRISTAPTLVGCIVGYSSLLYDYGNPINEKFKENNRSYKWEGTWAIYGLPFDLALRPNEKLLPDAPRTDEHWLVTYSKDTISYKPTMVGEFFIESIRQFRLGGHLVEHVELMVRVDDEDGLFFDQQHHLSKGCWRLQFIYDHSRHSLAGRNTQKLKKMSDKDYNVHKTLALSSSNENHRPFSMGWTA